jgi:tetratricopeptide (TPR) repeat protein
MGELKGAQEDADYLLQHTEGQEDVLLLSARLLHACGQDQQAIARYDEVTAVNPFQIDAYRERGKIKFDMGDKQGAEEDMQKVLELNPQEMADVSGDYSAEGIEHHVRQAYSAINPLGL